jgi:hypothetical protein
VLIASVARFPSIVTSTVGGDALGVKKYELAIIVFAITIFISVVGMIIYNEISKSKKV